MIDKLFHECKCPLMARFEMNEACGNMNVDGEDCPNRHVPPGMSVKVVSSSVDGLKAAVWWNGRDYEAEYDGREHSLVWKGDGRTRSINNIPECWIWQALVNDIKRFADGGLAKAYTDVEYIPLDKMVDDCIYTCMGRNFRLGIWHNGRMYGRRTEWGQTYVDTERHWDMGPEGHGTCKPLQCLTDPPKAA